MKILTVLLIVSVFFLGCNAKHCVTIGGEYQGINGNLEYCYEPVASKAAELPILKSTAGEELIALTKDQIKELIEPKPVAKDAKPELGVLDKLKKYLSTK